MESFKRLGQISSAASATKLYEVPVPELSSGTRTDAAVTQTIVHKLIVAETAGSSATWSAWLTTSEDTPAAGNEIFVEIALASNTTKLIHLGMPLPGDQDDSGNGGAIWVQINSGAITFTLMGVEIEG